MKHAQKWLAMLCCSSVLALATCAQKTPDDPLAVTINGVDLGDIVRDAVNDGLDRLLGDDG